MSEWQIHALGLGLIVAFIALMFFFVISVAFPKDKDGPRGGGFVE